MALALGAAVLSACGNATETGLEQLIESQGGGEVDLDLNDGGGFSLETEDGSMTIDEDGNFVVTDESGEVVTGNADGDGGINVQSDDGEFRMDSSGEIPGEWPDDVPSPDGLTGAMSSIQSTADVLAIAINGSADADFIEEYGAALEGAGYEQTTTFESAGNSTRIYDNGTWTVSINQFGEGDDTQASVSLFNSSS